MIRLNKYLAQCGVGSRRGCDQIIADGRVVVNGEKVTSMGLSVDEANDKVEVDGKPLKSEEEHVYVLLNKPKGYVTTSRDEQGRQTVLDLVDVDERVYPVGRLDKGTEGLLLLTNDGELSYRLTHPKYEVKKKYKVRIHRALEQKDLDKLQDGIMLEDGKTAPSRIFLNPRDRRRKSFYIIIHEGRKRQIRRMFEALNYRVIYLERVQIATLTLEQVPRGRWRHLTSEETHKLKRLVKLV